MKKTNLTKLISLSMLLFGASYSANAMHMSPEQALQRISRGGDIRYAPAAMSYTLVHTEAYDGEDMVYVFNKDDHGFVVVSADDRMPALLGYSDEGGVEAGELPPQLEWWLGQYARQGAFLCCNDADKAEQYGCLTRSDDEGKDNRDLIPPIIMSRWGQNSPYNLMCPTINGENTVTGCVATAMAQVIKHYSYPVSGIGTHSYSWIWSNDIPAEELSFDFGQTSFDYENMLYAYSQFTDSGDVEKMAVAQLMYACGVSVNANYGLEASGAPAAYVPYALSEFFGYDPGVRYLKRDFFSDEEWEDIIYDELEAGRPVIYGGVTSKGGGHEFICDGYQGNGLFHINWGWDGRGNGYYILSALDPNVVGTGGFDGGYNYDQLAILHISPSSGGDMRDVWYPLYSNGSLQVTGNNKTRANVSISQAIPNSGVFNYSPRAVDVMLCLKAVSDDGQEYYAASGPKASFRGMVGRNASGIGNFGTLPLPTGIPQGHYKLKLVFKTPEDKWQEVLFPRKCVSYINMDVDANGNVTCHNGSPAIKARIEVTDFRAENQVEPEKETSFYMALYNSGESDYMGSVSFKVFSKGSDIVVDTQSVTIPPMASGKTFSGHVNIAFNLEPGDYDIVFYDEYGEVCSDIFPLLVGESGVDAVMASVDVADVYSVSGQLVVKGADMESIRRLPKGIYILVCNGKVMKVAM